MNFLTLASECDTKNNAVSFLQTRGILHNPRLCKNKHEMVLQLTEKQDRWCCSKRECRQYAPLRADNFLASSRLDYETIVMFIYCWSKEYTSIMFCKEELNMNHNTTVDWNMYMREVCEYTSTNNSAKIGGVNTTVEIDESCFSMFNFKLALLHNLNFVTYNKCAPSYQYATTIL
ncbi:unnamed protein product [Macrosiphum euphorbiae]|uniref:Uncharacterized protein n=1 Tax=Macrosiphum euphorbiae TaxID=13131 RepID=A0AAV0XQU3_9HEMI|nr:unnamed protein product [Macrosiphum euphorbiae]